MHNISKIRTSLRGLLEKIAGHVEIMVIMDIRLSGILSNDHTIAQREGGIALKLNRIGCTKKSSLY